MGVPALVAGNFSGAIMGFCMVAVPFGLILLFIQPPPATETAEKTEAEKTENE